MVAVEAANPMLSKLPRQYPCQIPDCLVAHLKAILPVVVPQPDDIEIEHHGSQALREHFVPRLLREGEETPHIGKIRQPVVIKLVIQVVDVKPYLVPHSLERAGKGSYFIPAAIIQIDVVIGVRKPSGGVGKLFQGIGDDPHDEQYQYDVEDDHCHRDDQNGSDQPDPGGVDLNGWRDAHQLHAVGKRGKGHLPVLAVGGIADQLVAAAFLLEQIRMDAESELIRIAGDGKVRMIDHAPFRVHQADKARIVHVNIGNLLRQRIAGDIHAHQSDEHSGLVNRHEIGAYPLPVL